MKPRFKIHIAANRAVLDEDNQLVVMARTPEEASLFAAAPELLAALKDVAEQIAAYDYLHGANSCAIDAAPALAAIRDINPCYDPTVNITGTGMAQYISVYAATCQNRTERGIGH